MFFLTGNQHYTPKNYGQCRYRAPLKLSAILSMVHVPVALSPL